MPTEFRIQIATAADAPVVAQLVGELLTEITRSIGAQAFNFDFVETKDRLSDFLQREKYFVFVARDRHGREAGFVALTESHALYAEGVFGTIPEFYVRPEYRSQGLGLSLLSRAREFGISRGWKRLEVTTPPLPGFDRTLAFYEREGFAVTGGRKLKLLL